MLLIAHRSRPIVNTSASLAVYPTMINPEEKNCVLTSGNTSTSVSWSVFTLPAQKISFEYYFSLVTLHLVLLCQCCFRGHLHKHALPCALHIHKHSYPGGKV